MNEWALVASVALVCITYLLAVYVQAERSLSALREAHDNVRVDLVEVHKTLFELEEAVKRLGQAAPGDSKDLAELKNRFDRLAIAVGMGSVAYQGKKG